jgi:hypothetical protein
MPFLYLPDAISLTFVLIGLTLMRRSVVEHLQLEFMQIREHVRSYRSSAGLPDGDPALLALEQHLDSFIRLAPKVSPARLFFVYRQLRKGAHKPPPDPLSDLALCIESVADAKVRQRLLRFQVEMLLSVGVFFLMGSLSGWLLLAYILLRVTRRLFSHRSGERIDWSMELMEKLTYRIGRQAHRLILLTANSMEGA